jgi:ribonuclease-3
MKHRPIDELARRLRLRIAPDVLERAFLHSSFVNEVGDPRGSNERLEFLGDAVIDLAVTSHLYCEYPN